MLAFTTNTRPEEGALFDFQGLGFAVRFEPDPSFDGSTVNSLADIGLSYDSLALGIGSPREGKFQLRFSDVGGSIVQFGLTEFDGIVLTDVWSTDSFNLSQLTVLNGDSAELLANLGSVTEIEFRLQTDDANLSEIGNDNDNIILLDNIIITAPDSVPEPTSLVLLGFLGLAGCCTRRRS